MRAARRNEDPHGCGVLLTSFQTGMWGVVNEFSDRCRVYIEHVKPVSMSLILSL